MGGREPKPLLGRLGELPSLPAVYDRVRAAIEDPNSDFETVARLIETDPALNARVLRLANSALYGLSTKVERILHALTLIGLRATHHLVLATVLLSQFRNLPLGVVSMRSFWEHSVACGVLARLIARRGTSIDPDQAYLCGLLHDIGRLPLYLFEPLDMRAALQAHRERQGHLHDLERHYLGMDHTEVGQALLSQWQLPQVLCETAAAHHTPARPSAYPVEIAVVHVADLIVNSLRLGTSGTRWVPRLEDSAWVLTGLGIEHLPSLIETAVATTHEVTAAFLEG